MRIRSSKPPSTRSEGQPPLGELRNCLKQQQWQVWTRYFFVSISVVFIYLSGFLNLRIEVSKKVPAFSPSSSTPLCCWVLIGAYEFCILPLYSWNTKLNMLSREVTTSGFLQWETIRSWFGLSTQARFRMTDSTRRTTTSQRPKSTSLLTWCQSWLPRKGRTLSVISITVNTYTNGRATRTRMMLFKQKLPMTFRVM